MTDLAPPRPFETRTSPRALRPVRVLLVAFVVLAAFAGERDLWDADEGRYATVALDMARAGDLVTPREHGLRFVDKPPLVYWVADGAYALLGRTPFAARLPCILAGALLALAAALLGARAFGRDAGVCAAGVVVTSLAGMGFSRTVTMDMPLAAACAFAVYAGERALSDPRMRWPILRGGSIGLGLLAKGPLGAVLPVLVGLAAIAAGRPWRATLRMLVSPIAVLVALVVAAPWYALMERANPGYLEHFLVHEHVGRLAARGNRDFAPVWIYVPALAAFLLPWLPLLATRRGRARSDRGPDAIPPPHAPPDPTHPSVPVDPSAARPAAPRAGDARFLWAWALVLLAFFSVGRNRLFTYILPAFVPLAVLVGARVAERIGDGARIRRLAAVLALEGGLALVAGLGLAARIPFDLRWPGFHDERLVGLGLPAALGAIPLVLAPLLVRLVRGERARVAALFAASAVFFLGVDHACAGVDALRSPRALARALRESARPGDPIVALDVVPQGLRFYEDLDIRIAGKQREIVEPWASRDGAGVLLSRAELDALWSSSARVLLVVREEKSVPFVERGGRVLATRLSGGQRSDLVVVESRAP